jgi:hypothetical protein
MCGPFSLYSFSKRAIEIPIPLISEEIFRFDTFLAVLESPVDFFELLQLGLQSDPSLRASSLLPIFENRKSVRMDYTQQSFNAENRYVQNSFMIRVGGSSHEPGSVNGLDETIRLLITLWSEGKEILWENYANLIGHQVRWDVPIPSYEFDLKCF